MTAIQDDRQTGETTPGTYWRLSRGPLASLLFIAPLLTVYEIGVLQLGTSAARNGADLWLRGLLDTLGLGQHFVLPCLTIALLLAWQHLSGGSWRLSPRVVGCMAVESFGLAICLVLLAQVQGVACRAVGIPPLAVGDNVQDLSVRLVAFLGAGVYEEVLFRLMLVPAGVMALCRLGVSRSMSLVIAVLTTSLVFALAHYVGPYGDKWQAFSFLFRLAAGTFFALLFVYRGFGVTAGAHAGYDILVGAILTA